MTGAERRLRAFRRNRPAVAGLVVLCVILLAALFAPVLSGYGPEEQVGTEPSDIRSQPSWDHPLGTDENAFDVFARVLHGARTSLLIAASAIGLALLVSVPLGAVAGWRGGFVDGAIMRATDVLLSFPSLLLAIAIAALYGKGLAAVVLAVAVVSVPPILRQVRAAVLQVKALDYVTAARAVGVPGWRLLAGTVLPNCLGPIIVLATLGTGVAILDAAGLSFLGLGPEPPTAEWGVMLQTGFTYALHPEFWFLLVPPGAAIAVTVLGFNLFGDGLRDALDPRTAAEPSRPTES